MDLSNQVGCRYVVLETSESKKNFYSKCKFSEAMPIKDDKGDYFWMYLRTVLE